MLLRTCSWVFASVLVACAPGRDRRYWGTAAAGGGPFLGFTFQNLGGVQIYGAALGLDLWGGETDRQAAQLARPSDHS